MVKLRPLRMPLQREQVKQPLIWALVFAVIGIVTLIAVRAAPTDNFIDPESGSVSGLACVQSDSSASNGAAVRFGASSGTSDKSCPANGADLIVTQINITPAAPAGTIVGVLFKVDGSPATWSDNNTTSLAAGATVTLTANGSAAGSNAWSAVEGSHTVTAFTDDLNRIAESNDSNNTLDKTFTVTAGTTPPSGSAPGVLASFFPIGVFMQPTANFNTWKSRGINTLSTIPEGNDATAWINAANTAGLHQIRPPKSPSSADIGDKLLLAWSHHDEPDLVNTQISPSQIVSQYNSWKATDPNRQVFINVTGDLFQHDAVTNEGGDAWYAKYFKGADWISGDYYPVNRNKAISTLATQIDHLKSIAGSKPIFYYIETGNYNTTDGGRAPNAAEVRAEMWLAIIHGVRGLFFFPQHVVPSTAFNFDVTPADVAAEIPKQAAIITGLTNVLQGPIKPSGMSASATSPLEVTWRSGTSGKYIIALNLSASTVTQNITVTGVSGTATVYGENRTKTISGGVINDSFAPYAVHIYQIP